MQIVILSGGTGSRLWPASNTQSPKPFIRMEDGLTLIQKTFIRVSNIKQVQNIIVITNYMYAERVKDECLATTIITVHRQL